MKLGKHIPHQLLNLIRARPAPRKTQQISEKEIPSSTNKWTNKCNNTCRSLLDVLTPFFHSLPSVYFAFCTYEISPLQLFHPKTPLFVEAAAESKFPSSDQLSLEQLNFVASKQFQFQMFPWFNKTSWTFVINAVSRHLRWISFQGVGRRR